MQFDVAVTVERGKTGGGTDGIRIAVVEAKLGGGAETRDATVSRVGFSVPILMPRRNVASFAGRRWHRLKCSGANPVPIRAMFTC